MIFKIKFPAVFAIRSDNFTARAAVDSAKSLLTRLTSMVIIVRERDNASRLSS